MSPPALESGAPSSLGSDVSIAPRQLVQMRRINAPLLVCARPLWDESPTCLLRRFVKMPAQPEAHWLGS